MDDIRLLMDEAMAERPPDFVQAGDKPEHGRIERRSIWVSSEINDYAEFPGVGQVFAVQREVVEAAYGITSLDPEAAGPKRLLELNRGHWRVESLNHRQRGCVYGEDARLTRTGNGPANRASLNNIALAEIFAKRREAESLAGARRQLQLDRTRPSPPRPGPETPKRPGPAGRPPDIENE